MKARKDVSKKHPFEEHAFKLWTDLLRSLIKVIWYITPNRKSNVQSPHV